MAKRVGVVLSGCGGRDGSEIVEVVTTLLAIQRSGAEAVCAAPDVKQAHVVDHRTGAPEAGAAPRGALAEAARFVGGRIVEIGALAVDDVDALIVPGGEGVASVLSDYAEKGQTCAVHPDV